MSQTQVTRLMRIGWQTVGNIVTRVVAEKLPAGRLDGPELIGVDEVSYGWFASESMTQIRVLISPHLRGFRLHQEGVLDDRAGTFRRQQRWPSIEAVSVAFAEV